MDSTQIHIYVSYTFTDTHFSYYIHRFKEIYKRVYTLQSNGKNKSIHPRAAGEEEGDKGSREDKGDGLDEDLTFTGAGRWCSGNNGGEEAGNDGLGFPGWAALVCSRRRTPVPEAAQ